MTTQWGAASQGLDAGQTDWHIACELLKAGQYEQVAELLGQAQITSEGAGDASLAQILAAARRICQACNQVQAEGEWYQQAHQEAGRREQDLRQQLQAILDSISGRETLDADEKLETALSSSLIKIPSHQHITPEVGEPPGLWRRIQTLFGRGASRQIPQDETPVLYVEASTPSLVLYCLGPFRAYQNDELITSWNGLKGQCILKYLVTQGRRPVTKDILMDLFWRDADPEAARRNLHQAIYGLRQTLRRGRPDFQHIQFENDCYLLNPEMGIWLDSTEFEKHVQAGRRLETAGYRAEAMTEYGIAEGLYQGDFLEEDLYEDWPKVRREHIRTAYLDIADRLSKHYIQQGEHTAAIALCQKILVRDNCHEEAHRRLMRCYLAQGQRHLAVRQYQTCMQTLKEELDLTPSEETVELYQRITTGV